MANGPMILDLKHPTNNVLQFPTAGRVGDAGIQVKLWIKDDGRPFDLTGYEVGIYGNDAQGFPKIIHEDPTGTSVQSGNILFTLPGALFRAAGEYKECFFKVLKDGVAISSVDIKFNVLENNVEFNMSNQPYISDAEDLKRQLENIVFLANGKFDDEIAYMKKVVGALVTNTNTDLKGLLDQIKTVQNAIDGVEALIKSKNVATKEDLKNAFQGTRVAANSDLNNFKTPGFYYNEANADAKTMKNTPEPIAFSLQVYKTAGVVQVYTTYGPAVPHVYIRSNYENSWGYWQQVASVDDLPKSTSYSLDGVVLTNGAKWYSTPNSNFGYSTTKLTSGKTLVELNLILLINVDKIIMDTSFVQIPANVAPKYDRNIVSSSSYASISKWDIHKDGKIVSHDIDKANLPAGKEIWVPIQAMWTI